MLFFFERDSYRKRAEKHEIEQLDGHGEPGKLFEMEAATEILQGRLVGKGYLAKWIRGKQFQKNGSSMVSEENKHI